MLVGGWATPLKNMKVNWDDEIPNIWDNKKCSNHQPDYHGLTTIELHLYLLTRSLVPGFVTFYQYVLTIKLRSPSVTSRWRPDLLDLLTPSHSPYIQDGTLYETLWNSHLETTWIAYNNLETQIGFCIPLKKGNKRWLYRLAQVSRPWDPKSLALRNGAVPTWGSRSCSTHPGCGWAQAKRGDSMSTMWINVDGKNGFQQDQAPPHGLVLDLIGEVKKKLSDHDLYVQRESRDSYSGSRICAAGNVFLQDKSWVKLSLLPQCWKTSHLLYVFFAVSPCFLPVGCFWASGNFV